MTPAARSGAGAVLWVVLVLPPLRHALQDTMTAQMLIQIPLLAVAGWLVTAAIPPRLDRALARWNRGGIAGLLLSSFAGAVWMLPRMLDASVADPRFLLAKFVTVPLLIGAPVAVSWPAMGFVARGVALLELVATAYRLGWLYLISPVRLCSNYLLGDQQRLGRALLAVGMALTLLLGWKLLWGRIRIEDHPASSSP